MHRLKCLQKERSNRFSLIDSFPISIYLKVWNVDFHLFQKQNTISTVDLKFSDNTKIYCYFSSVVQEYAVWEGNILNTKWYITFCIIRFWTWKILIRVVIEASMILSSYFNILIIFVLLFRKYLSIKFRHNLLNTL